MGRGEGHPRSSEEGHDGECRRGMQRKPSSGLARHRATPSAQSSKGAKKEDRQSRTVIVGSDGEMQGGGCDSVVE